MPDRELLDTVLDMHRAVQVKGDLACIHCTFFGERETYYTPYPCATRLVIEEGRKDA